MSSTPLSDLELARRLMIYTGHIARPTIYLFLISAIIYVAALLSGLLGFLPLWITCVVNTICAYLLFTPLHEAAHQNIKGKSRKLKWLENAIGWISGLSLMAPFPMFKRLHIIHHGHTNDPHKDPDYWVASGNYFGVFVKCMTTYFAYFYHYFRDSREILSDSKGRKGYWWSIFTLVLLASAVVFAASIFGWTTILLTYVLPGYLALGFLAFAFDWLPHHPHAIRQRYLDTRIILKPGLSTLLVSQNMHLVHHLYAGVPYYHYADALEVLKDKILAEGGRIESSSNI